jgi:hypothetical protein
VMPQLFPVILALHNKVPCPKTFGALVAAVLAKSISKT